MTTPEQHQEKKYYVSPSVEPIEIEYKSVLCESYSNTEDPPFFG